MSSDLLLQTGLATAALGLVAVRRRELLRRADEEGHAEDNTYGLPDGEPIADELRKWFRDQRDAVLAAIPDSGPLPERFPELTGDDWTDPMKKAMTPLLGAYWDESGKDVYQRLGLDPEDWRVVNPHLAAQIGKQALAFCQSTNQTTSKRLETALTQLRQQLTIGMVEEGESLRELTGRVKHVFEGLSTSHAGLIAATEASRAVHAAELQADVDSEVVEGLELLLSSDACPLCRKIATECKRVRLGQAFAVIGKHPEYKDIKHPPIHPRCQCTIIEVLKPEYGGPAHVEWGHTLVQPQQGLTKKSPYTPPEGKQVPPPEPEKAKPKPTVPARPAVPKTIAERLAAYTAGDAKLAAIAAIGDRIDTLAAGVEAAEAHYRSEKDKLTSDEWLDSNKKARPKRDALSKLYDQKDALIEQLYQARLASRDQIVKVLEVPAGERFQWNGANDQAISSTHTRKEARSVLDALSRLVHGSGTGAKASTSAIDVTWENFKPGEEQREYHLGEGLYNQKRTSKVVIGTATLRQVIAHELGHAIEWQVPGVHARVKEFLDYRIGAEPPVRLDTLFPASNYRPGEVGRKDHFDRYFNTESAYYCGKVFSHENSEIVSMGIQALFENPARFAAKDPEYAKFILGILDGSLR